MTNELGADMSASKKLAAEVKSRFESLDWRIVRIWGNNRFVRSAYIWLAIVPLCAKPLKHFTGVHMIDFFGTPLQIDIGLPFSLKAFFLAAIFVSAAQFLYTFRCPDVTKRFRNFGEFRRDHLGRTPFIRWVSYVVMNVDYKHLQGLSNGVLTSAEGRAPFMLPAGNSNEQLASNRKKLIEKLEKFISKYQLQEAVMSDAFEHSLEVGARINYGACVVCSTFYAIGTILFIIVMVQNITSVFTLLW